MEKYISSLDAISNVFPIHEQKLDASMTMSQSNKNKQKHRENVFCHLCAIEVPRRFLNEHYESDKHKINTKIADVALQRVQKSLQHNIVSDIDKIESLYFCPQCVISMNPKDRKGHEKTVVHKRALTVDKFLYEFYVLYANDDVNQDLARECEASVAENSNVVVQINATDNISPNVEKYQLMNVPEKMEVKTDNNVRNTTENVINSSDVVQVNAIDNIRLDIDKNQLMNVSEKFEVKAVDNVRNTTENVINSIDAVQINETDNICPNIEKNQLMNVSEKIEVKTDDSVRNTTENVINLNNVVQVNAIDNISPNNVRNTTENVKHSNEVVQINDNISPNIEKNQLRNESEKIEVKTEDSVRNTTVDVIDLNPLENDAICNSIVIKVDKKTNNPVTRKVDSTSPFNDSQFCSFGSKPNHIFCKACKVYVPNHQSNILSHQKGFKHIQVLHKIKNGH